jgi:hypothetical protein
MDSEGIGDIVGQCKDGKRADDACFRVRGCVKPYYQRQTCRDRRCYTEAESIEPFYHEWNLLYI